jgi:hypothetical protein
MMVERWSFGEVLAAAAVVLVVLITAWAVGEAVWSVWRSFRRGGGH